MSRSRYRIFESEYPYFLTCTIVGWLPIFTHPENVEIVLNSWRFLTNNARLTIYGYVIMENHLHFIASSERLTKEVADFKSFTARQIIDQMQSRNLHHILDQLRMLKAAHKTDREFQLWQEGSHPQQIMNEEMMRQKLEYMHLNPVKRGYVDKAEHWRYSSARDYSGVPGIFPVEMNWG